MSTEVVSNASSDTAHHHHHHHVLADVQPTNGIRIVVYDDGTVSSAALKVRGPCWVTWMMDEAASRELDRDSIEWDRPNAANKVFVDRRFDTDNHRWIAYWNLCPDAKSFGYGVRLDDQRHEVDPSIDNRPHPPGCGDD